MIKPQARALAVRKDLIDITARPLLKCSVSYQLQCQFNYDLNLCFVSKSFMSSQWSFEHHIYSIGINKLVAFMKHEFEQVIYQHYSQTSFTGLFLTHQN